MAWRLEGSSKAEYEAQDAVMLSRAKVEHWTRLAGNTRRWDIFQGICRYVGIKHTGIPHKALSANISTTYWWPRSWSIHLAECGNSWDKCMPRTRTTTVSWSGLLHRWSRKRIRQVGSPTQPRLKQRKKRTQENPSAERNKKHFDNKPNTCAVCWIMRQREQTRTRVLRNLVTSIAIKKEQVSQVGNTHEQPHDVYSTQSMGRLQRTEAHGRRRRTRTPLTS